MRRQATRQSPSSAWNAIRPSLRLAVVILTSLFAGQEALLAGDNPDSRVFPKETWSVASPGEARLAESRLQAARDYALTGGGSGHVTRAGKLVMSWGDPRKRYDLKSTTKSIGVTALGLAIQDGKLAVDDKARRYHPTLGTPPAANAETGWLDEITIMQLATQTAGFEKTGGFGKLLFKPGSKWCYSDGGPNWLAECITKVYGQDLNELMFDRVFGPIGITPNDLVWRENDYRPKQLDGVKRREFGSGISANVDAMARIGYLYLRQGRWNGKRIVPTEFVKQASTTVSKVVGLEEVDAANYGNASDHYGLLWWNNADGTLEKVPRDAFWSWGLYDSLIVVMPSLDIVAVRAGGAWPRQSREHYEVLRPFLEPIALAAGKTDDRDADLLERKISARRSASKALAPPYPPSQVVTRVEWAAAAEITRRARGSDNWPMTWGDDDALYTAYGDGKGFEPTVELKLSLGLSRITGGANDFIAENIRSPTVEMHGDGAIGKKASGMLMVDGVLYLLVRNAGNSQLAWSRDHGRTWTWSAWKFTKSFGCPTLLNFGRNYAARATDASISTRTTATVPISRRTGWCSHGFTNRESPIAARTNSSAEWSRAARLGVRTSTIGPLCFRFPGSAVAHRSAMIPLLSDTYGAKPYPATTRGLPADWESTMRLNPGAPGLPCSSRKHGTLGRAKQQAFQRSGWKQTAGRFIWCFPATTIFPFARQP